MTYAYLTKGKTKAQIIEVDRILAGPQGETPQAVAAANAEAMKLLGGVGQVPPRPKKRKR